MNKRILLTLTAVVMTAALLCTNALAATKNKVRKVELNLTNATMSVGQRRTLIAYLTPTDADDREIEWVSSDYDIVIVEGDGEIVGISPGTAVITAYASNEKSASCVVTVSGSAVKNSMVDVTTDELYIAGIDGGDTLYSSTLRKTVEDAIDNKAEETTTAVTFSNKSNVSSSALRGGLVSAQYQNKNVVYYFNTTNSAGWVQGQIYIDPKNVGTDTRNVKLGVYTQPDYTSGMKTRAQKKFGNNVAVVYLAHPDQFGMTVRVAANVDLSGMNTKNLKLYRYDINEKTYTLLSNQNYSFTDGGLIRFRTDVGGYIIITDK